MPLRRRLSVARQRLSCVHPCCPSATFRNKSLTSAPARFNFIDPPGAAAFDLNSGADWPASGSRDAVPDILLFHRRRGACGEESVVETDRACRHGRHRRRAADVAGRGGGAAKPFRARQDASHDHLPEASSKGILRFAVRGRGSKRARGAAATVEDRAECRGRAGPEGAKGRASLPARPAERGRRSRRGGPARGRSANHIAERGGRYRAGNPRTGRGCR
jgi:hypothetical protein